MKTLLVPVLGLDGLRAIVDTACLAGLRFGSLIEGCSFQHALADYLRGNAAGNLPWHFEEQVRASEVARAEDLARKQAFADAMKTRAMRAEAAPGSEASFRWRTEPLRGDHVLGQQARLFGATVIGRPESSGASPDMATFETLLFEGGRPILIAPPVAPASLGETILIAWNGSTETARAVALAEPFLRRAKHVWVLAIEGSSVPGPSAQELAEALSLAGIAAEARTLTSSRISSGEIFLAEAQALGCDLLIKGAYTQSRLRQMFFGGATSHILRHAKLPVLMAH
ncbi:universal stress protein [Methylobacterium nigriterrae]|uniref:universal stress protein n=1 Tax=Methylobacterium nigriterrae TaxID=3127512 RepID=UPI0030136E2B